MSKIDKIEILRTNSFDWETVSKIENIENIEMVRRTESMTINEFKERYPYLI